jgi:hypothetical protein
MSYFEDLSDYVYHNLWCYRPQTKNVGWLSAGHRFETWNPPDDTLSCLLDYCTVAIAQMRGSHMCEFCPQSTSRTATKDGRRLLLGSAEIRVFGSDGNIYAAPNLVYHYVSAHRYRPPATFLRALAEGPRPPSPEYFEVLARLELEWNNTSEYAGPAFRFVKRNGVLIKEIIAEPDRCD